MNGLNECVLAVTGSGNDQLLVAAGVGLLLVAAGTALFLRKSRKRGLAVMAALILVGGIALAPTLTATPALAAQSDTCDPVTTDTIQDEQEPTVDTEPDPDDRPDDRPDDIVIPTQPLTPTEPTLVDAPCGVEKTIQIPVVKDVQYTQERDGNVITVTATPLNEAEFTDGSITMWTLDVTPAVCACVADPLPFGDGVTYDLDVRGGAMLASDKDDWLAAISAAGATYSLNIVIDLENTYRFKKTFGGVSETFDQMFPTSVTVSGVPRVEGSTLLADWAVGQIVTETEALALVRAENPNATVELDTSASKLAWNHAATLEVSAIDSCGEMQTRSYTTGIKGVFGKTTA